MKRALLVAVTAFGLIAWACPDELRWQIESEILRVHEAIRAEDIGDYMEVVPPDLELRGGAMAADRQQVREEVLRGWEGVQQTHLIEATVERLERRRDGAVDVWYAQRWDRTQVMEDGAPHRVLSERRYRETWRRRGVRWFRYEIEDLGGRVWVDGRLQG